MSDPGDPLRFEEISDGLNIFGENVARLRREFEEFTNLSLSDTFKKIRESFKKLPNELEPLFRKIKEDLPKSMKGFTNLKALNPMTKEINKPKFGRTVKSLSGMFGKMGSSSLSVSVVSKLFDTLKPLLDLFKPFQVILDIISSLIQVMVGEALGPMFEALQPVYDLFISMVPLFQTIGGQLGELLVAVITPIVDIITQMAPLFEILLSVFIQIVEMSLEPLIMILEFFADHIDDLMPLFESIIGLLIPLTELGLVPLMVILEVLFAVIEPLLPYIELLADALDAMSPVISFIAYIIGEVFMGALYGAAIGFAFLIDVFTLGLAGAVKEVKKMFKGLFPEEEEDGESDQLARGYIDIPGRHYEQYYTPELQGGGITLSEGLYHLHDKEIVAPLDPFTKEQLAQKALLTNILSELINQSSIQRKTYLEKKFNNMFKG